jgi:IPT/TIG domain
MRRSSLACVVVASLPVSVVITCGCGKPPTPGGRSPPPSFSVRSISPTEGPSIGATVATIEGTGFESGATVTVDGSRVDATVLSANTISLSMTAHAAVMESGGWKT